MMSVAPRGYMRRITAIERQRSAAERRLPSQVIPSEAKVSRIARRIDRSAGGQHVEITRRGEAAQHLERAAAEEHAVELPELPRLADELTASVPPASTVARL